MLKNIAGQVIGVQMTNVADGLPFTGVVTVYLVGDGGVQAIGSIGSGICTHEGKGFHSYAPAQAETNYNHIAWTFEGTGAITTTVQVFTGGNSTLANQTTIISMIGSLGTDVLAAITVESGVIGNFPETLTIGDSYTSNTGQIKISITDASGDPITTFGSLALADAIIEFTAFRPNDSAVITGTCVFVDAVTETYVLLTLSSIQTSLGVAEYTYEGRLKFFWEGAISSSSIDSDDEQKTYKTTPFKFISNP